MKIVFLNLADRHEQGLARTTVAALRRKYPRYSWIYEMFAGSNSVDLVDLFDLLAYQRRPPAYWTLTSFIYGFMAHVRELTEVRRRCREADKIMLGVHGHYGDADHGHANMGWQSEQGVVGTYRDFAKLLKSILETGRPYRLSLVMCYGARSPNFQVNHDDPHALTPQEVKGSFAYKLFRELCLEYDVKMTARTGALGFDSVTGASMVQTEAAVLAEAEYDDLELRQLTGAREAQEAVQERILREDGHIRRFRAMETRIVDGGQPTNDDERIIQRFIQLKARANVLMPLKSADAAKHGKFIYTYDRETNHIVVTSRYPQPVVLYDGPP